MSQSLSKHLLNTLQLQSVYDRDFHCQKYGGFKNVDVIKCRCQLRLRILRTESTQEQVESTLHRIIGFTV